METIYGKKHSFNIGHEAYQLQMVTEPENIYFVVTLSGEFLCKVSFNEMAQWRPDCDITTEQMQAIEQAIKKFYLS